VPVAARPQTDESLQQTGITRIHHAGNSKTGSGNPGPACQQVKVSISEGCMIVEPKMRPRYTLAELLSQGDFTQPITSDEREWLDAPPFGGEGL
jgi:hypothetical protein